MNTKTTLSIASIVVATVLVAGALVFPLNYANAGLQIHKPHFDFKKITIKKVDIKQRDAAPSGMPPGFGDALSKRELRDVVEFVANLK